MEIWRVRCADYGLVNGWHKEREQGLPYWQRDLDHLVIVSQGAVFVSREVATMAGDPSFPSYMSDRAALCFGRRKFHRIDAALLDEWQERNGYEPRNDREARIRQSRREIVDWLRGLGSLSHIAAPANGSSLKGTQSVPQAPAKRKAQVSDFVAATMAKYGFPVEAE